MRDTEGTVCPPGFTDEVTKPCADPATQPTGLKQQHRQVLACVINARVEEHEDRTFIYVHNLHAEAMADMY